MTDPLDDLNELTEPAARRGHAAARLLAVAPRRPPT